NFIAGRAFGQRHRLAVDGAPLPVGQGFTPVNRIAKNVEGAAENLRPDRHPQWLSPMSGDGATGQSLGRGEGDAAYPVGVEMQSDLNDDLLAVTGMEKGVDLWEFAVKVDIHHRAAYSDDGSWMVV